MKPYVIIRYPDDVFQYGYGFTREERNKGAIGLWHCARTMKEFDVEDGQWLREVSFVMCDTEADAMAFISRATKENPGRTYLKCLTSDIFYTEASPMRQAKFTSDGLTPV